MMKQKEGFCGERSVVLPPMAIEMEQHDPLVSSLYITDIGYYPRASLHGRSRQQPISEYPHLLCQWSRLLHGRIRALYGV